MDAGGAAAIFFVELGALPLPGALTAGGVLATLRGGWPIKRIAPNVLMVAVGALTLALAAWQLAGCSGSF